MKKILAAMLAMGGLLTPASASILITEINSNATANAVQVDFWELTNTGPSAVDLSGWIWDDDSANPADPTALTIGGGISISSGESIVFAVTSDVAAFRTAWNLSGSVQVISGGPGLGQNDAINLFNQSSVLQTSLSYAINAFTRSSGALSLGGHAGISAGGSVNTQSLILDPDFGTVTPRYTFATGSNFGTFANVAGNFGSPGISAIPEPGTIAMLAVGLTLLGLHPIRRLRKRALVRVSR